MKPRAVIFEKVESLRNLLTIALRDRNYEVYSFADPSICPLYNDASCTCPQTFPCGDLLIIDNHFPHMTGLELIQRHVAKGCKAMVSNTAIMSDHWTTEELETARSLGCKVFEKPFRFKDFSSWLDSREKTFSPQRELAPLTAEKAL